jgi:hypothetical protein
MDKRFKIKGTQTTMGILLREKKRTVLDVCKVMGLGYSQTFKLLNNPFTMRLNQLMLLSGYLDIPLLELVAKLQYNVRAKELSKEQKGLLSGLVEKYSKTQ